MYVCTYVDSAYDDKELLAPEQCLVVAIPLYFILTLRLFLIYLEIPAMTDLNYSDSMYMVDTFLF